MNPASPGKDFGWVTAKFTGSPGPHKTCSIIMIVIPWQLIPVAIPVASPKTPPTPPPKLLRPPQHSFALPKLLRSPPQLLRPPPPEISSDTLPKLLRPPKNSSELPKTPPTSQNSSDPPNSPPTAPQNSFNPSPTPPTPPPPVLVNNYGSLNRIDRY